MKKIIILLLSFIVLSSTSLASSELSAKNDVCDITALRCPAGVDLDSCTCVSLGFRTCNTASLSCTHGINYSKCKCRDPKKEKEEDN